MALTLISIGVIVFCVGLAVGAMLEDRFYR
jgi:hypothetical protein